MHYWGDDWEYWGELYEAQNYIYDYVKRWSGCSLYSKEKYGTIRYEHLFVPYTGIYYRGIVQKYWQESFIVRIWYKWGRRCMFKAVIKACEKYPNTREELLHDFFVVATEKEMKIIKDKFNLINPWERIK